MALSRRNVHHKWTNRIFCNLNFRIDVTCACHLRLSHEIDWGIQGRHDHFHQLDLTSRCEGRLDKELVQLSSGTNSIRLERLAEILSEHVQNTSPLPVVYVVVFPGGFRQTGIL